MRTLIFFALAALSAPSVLAQTASRSTTSQEAVAAASLPVRRVILYKTGVGYFEHRGRVIGNQDLSIRFTSGQLNDVLKSLTALDLGDGQISGISYNSAAPLDRRMSALRLPVGRNATLTDLLAELRGARVRFVAGGETVSGRLLSVERQKRQTGPNAAADVDMVSIVTDSGELRAYEVGASLRIAVAEPDLRQEIGQYLDLVGSTREQDVRRLVIRTTGSAAREILISYISEVPVWKTTYRLVLPPNRGEPILQGWAIVDNTIGEDWTNVQLSLVAGAPQTFIQPIAQPYYTRRPVVPLPRSAMVTPQTHEATLEAGPGTLAGTVKDVSGAILPGVRVLLRDGTRQATATTDGRGEYRLMVPAGVYQVEFQLTGFQSVVLDGVVIGGATTRRQDATLAVGVVSETVTVTGETPAVRARRDGGVAGGVVGGVAGGVASPPPPPPAAPVVDAQRALQPAAIGTDLGDLFQYQVKEPVTIAKNASALVPILNERISVEKVSLWTRGSASGRPLRAVWITNTTGLTLDGGSFSIVEEEAFAGEGLIEPLEPGERRLLSYAADLGVLVSTQTDKPSSRIVRLRASAGIVSQDTEERTKTMYRIRNEDEEPRVVVVEHPIRSDWRLAGGPEPAERSTGVYRFRVPVEARGEAALEVTESRSAESKFAIGDFDESLLQVWIRSGFASADIQRLLKPVVDKRRELAAAEQRIAELETERGAILEDQQRLRENVKVLGRSAEERQLLQRYARQLDEQENRLEVIGRELGRIKRERDQMRQDLAQLISETTFEVK